MAGEFHRWRELDACEMQASGQHEMLNWVCLVGAMEGRRVEVVFPVEQADLKARLIDEILRTTLADNVKARELQPDGTYKRVKPKPGEAAVRSQQRFLELAEEASARLAAAQAAGSGAVPIPNGVAKPKLAARGKRRT